MLTKLKTLVKMQLKAKIDLSFLKSKRDTLLRLLILSLCFFAVTGAVYLVFHFAVRFHMLTLTKRLPLKVLVFIFTIMQLLSIVTTTNGLIRGLYFSGDNQILLTLPLRQNMVFISKLIVFYIKELQKNSFFLLPVFIAFGLINGYSFGYYPVMLVSFFFISMLPVAIGAVLSIPGCFITMIMRDLKFLQVLFAALGAGAIVYFFFSIVSSIPANLDIIGSFGTYYWRIQELLDSFERAFKPFAYLVSMAAGADRVTWHQPLTLYTPLILVCFLAVIAALIAIAFFIARPLYFKMVSKPYEHKSKKRILNRTNKQRPRFISALKKELLLIFRSPHTLFNTLMSFFVLPFAIFLLNKIFSAMHTRLLGDYMSLSFNVLMLLLIMLNGNVSAASVFSGEGAAVYVVKTKPESVRSALLAKLFIYLVTSILSAIISAIIIYSVNTSNDLKMSSLAAVFICLISVVLSAGHIFWSVQLDITNPQYRHYVDGAHVGTNPNETSSIISAFALSFIFFGLTLLLLRENASTAWYKVFAAAVVFLAARVYLLISNIKVYFKEM